MMTFSRRQAMATFLSGIALPLDALAQRRYGPGASDSEIRIGSTVPMSGPVSNLGMLGKAAQAYIAKLNAGGGINGRKISLIQYDDAYNPAKAFELTRKLVEQDEVLFIFQTVGSSSNTAIHRYLETKRIPQLLIYSGANKWSDPTTAPWVVPATPSYSVEGRVYSRWLLQNMPDSKIALLLQNDEFGHGYLAGIKEGLGSRAQSMIVAQSFYETSDASVESQVVSLKSSGANVFFSMSNGKFTVQSLRKAYEIGWKPQIFLPVGSASLSSIIRPAGVEKAVGAMTGAVSKSASDPEWDKDEGMNGLRDFARRWMAGGDPNDALLCAGYGSAQVLEQILRQCGDDLTREKVMAQALNLRDFAPPTALPGIKINTSKSNHALYTQLWLQRFDGNAWAPFGGAISQ